MFHHIFPKNVYYFFCKSLTNFISEASWFWSFLSFFFCFRFGAHLVVLTV